MIEKMAMGLVDQMAEEKMIDKEAEEYYVYTLVSLMEKFITIGTILLISVLIEKLVPTVHIPQELRIRSRGTERCSASN